MTTFAPADSWASLFAQATPRSYGVLMSPLDPRAVKVSAQVAVRNVSAGTWDSAAWDSDVWDDPDFATWEDVTARVRGVDWDRGSTDPLLAAAVGTCSITFANGDGEVSPWATSGPFTNPVPGSPVWDVTGWDQTVPGSGASLMRPGTPVRIGATYRLTPGTDAGGFGWFPYFSGLIESIVEDSVAGADGWVTLGLVEVLAALADAGSGHGTTGGGALIDGATASNMVAGLLIDAGWQYALFDEAGIVSGDLFLTAPTSLPALSDNRLVAAQTLCASTDTSIISRAGGGILVSALGFTIDTGFTFSNSPVGSELPLAADGITPYSSTDRLLNVVTGTSTNTGALPQTISDPASVDTFGRRATALGWPRTDIALKNDTDVLKLVTLVANRQANDFLGISAISLDADMRPEELFYVLSFFASQGLEPARAFSVRWIHVSGAEWRVTVYPVGFAFSLTMQGDQAKFTADLRTATV